MADNGPSESRIYSKLFSDFHQRGMEGTAHYFVCSFSSDDDDLGQWRAYADNGRGYALGFDGKALEELFTKQGEVPIPNNCSFQVTYNDAVLAGIHRRLIDSMFGLISLPKGKNMDEGAIRAYLKKLSVDLSLYVLRTALFFKHEAYKNESEYRFLEIHRADIPPPDVKRRYRSYEAVKFREFQWKRLHLGSLKKIVIGPAADREKATLFAADCLKVCDLGGVEVVCSEIPYRAI